MANLYELDQHIKEKCENTRMTNIANGLNEITKLSADGLLNKEHRDIIDDRLTQPELLHNIQIFKGESEMREFLEEATNKHVTRIGMKPFDAFEIYKVKTLFGMYQPKTKRIKSFVYVNRNGSLNHEVIESSSTENEMEGLAFTSSVIICELNIEVATRDIGAVEWYKPAEVAANCNHLLIYVPKEKGENN